MQFAAPSTSELFLRLSIALGLGLLVGLERERSASGLAGFRTFPLVTLLGSLSALLAPQLGTWLPAAGFLALGLVIAIGHFTGSRAAPDGHTGITTEVALLLMFLVGAGLALGYLASCVVVAACTAVLLHAKQRMHSFAQRLSEEDVLVLFRFVLIALVVLPVLPDRAFGPFEVLNPKEIWWMVVLIVGIGLASYVAYRLFGQKAGTLLAGLLGGLISSTATTASYARRTRGAPAIASTAALVVLIATTVVYARVGVLLAVVAPGQLRELLPPVLALGGFFVVLCVVFWLRREPVAVPMEHAEQAAELRPALIFGLIYAAVLFAVAAARHYFTGTGALYGVAAISGLTDVDAITLSTGRLVDAGQLEPGTAWRLIVLATLTNLGFKGALGFVLGGRALGRRLALSFGLGALAGCALLALWP
ncbi:MAG: MgtC/SapB family protein [Planctomycetes bacterium]|nr:MgtC/SapB family protein [Planctomycetota bacterium]